MTRPFILCFSLFFALQGCGVVANHFNQEGAEAFGQKDLAKAKAKFAKAVSFDDSNPTFHNNLGYTLYLLRELPAAEKEFRAALDHKPDEKLGRQVRINQVMLYGDGKADATKPEFKDWNEKGIKVLQGLIAEDGENAEFHMRLGFAYFRAVNPGGGFSELDSAVRLATPEKVGRYSADPIQGSIFILEQIQRFYAKVRYFKKAKEVQGLIDQVRKKQGHR